MQVRRNHLGYRVGEHHHRAKLSDEDVAHMRRLRAQGVSYGRLARLFDCGESTARDICLYWTRP